jgi:hypothetical protein
MDLDFAAAADGPTAALAWNGDLPRLLQRILFDAAVGIGLFGDERYLTLADRSRT